MDRLAVVELIGATTTKTGLKVESALDTRSYQKGIKVRKAEMNMEELQSLVHVKCRLERRDGRLAATPASP